MTCCPEVPVGWVTRFPPYLLHHIALHGVPAQLPDTSQFFPVLQVLMCSSCSSKELLHHLPRRDQTPATALTKGRSWPLADPRATHPPLPFLLPRTMRVPCSYFEAILQPSESRGACADLHDDQHFAQRHPLLDVAWPAICPGACLGAFGHDDEPTALSLHTT